MTSKSTTPKKSRSQVLDAQLDEQGSWHVPAVPWTPHGYQKKAVKFLLEHAAAALFLDLGLGKTSIVLAAIMMLIKRKMINRVLLVAPLRVAHSVWPDEALKWTDFKNLRIVVLHGKDKDALLEQEADIYIINPEGLEWLLQPKKTRSAKGKVKVSVDIRKFKRHGFDTLVIDEMTKFKNHQSTRFKMMRHVIGTFGRRWGLTGSPAANGLLGLFGQMYMIDEGRSLGSFITKYRAEYFLPGYDGFTWILQEDGEERIYKRLAPIALRMAAEDYMDLPALIENVVRVDIPDDAWFMYESLENDLLAMIGTSTVTAKNTGVAMGKCRQVAGGAIYDEPGLGELVKKKRDKKRDWLHVHDAKLDALEDMIDELQGAPIMVAYEFQHELERIRDRLGKDIPYIGSGVSPKQSKVIERDWNAGLIPVLLVHPQSVAHGLNMQKSGQHICWYTLTWDRELFDQLIGRLRRQGSVNTRIFLHMLIARGTVDEVVLGSLRKKERGQAALFNGLRELQRSRRSRRSVR